MSGGKSGKGQRKLRREAEKTVGEYKRIEGKNQKSRGFGKWNKNNWSQTKGHGRNNKKYFCSWEDENGIKEKRRILSESCRKGICKTEGIRTAISRIYKQSGGGASGRIERRNAMSCLWKHLS